MARQTTDVVPLDPEVERGAECFYGTYRGCDFIRCGSGCDSRFDRMHPCPGCLVALIGDLRSALNVAGVNPWTIPRYAPPVPRKPPGKGSA